MKNSLISGYFFQKSHGKPFCLSKAGSWIDARCHICYRFYMLKFMMWSFLQQNMQSYQFREIGFSESQWATSYWIYVIYFWYICFAKFATKVLITEALFVKRSLKIFVFINHNLYKSWMIWHNKAQHNNIATYYIAYQITTNTTKHE